MTFKLHFVKVCVRLCVFGALFCKRVLHKTLLRWLMFDQVTCSQDKATSVGHQLERQPMKLSEGQDKKTVSLGLLFLVTVNFLLALCSSCLGLRHPVTSCNTPVWASQLFAVRFQSALSLLQSRLQPSSNRTRQSVIPPAATRGNVLLIGRFLTSKLPPRCSPSCGVSARRTV